MLACVGMGRPKKYNLPDNMTFDVTNACYVVRNPLTKKSKTFAIEADAVVAAEAVNDWLKIQAERASLTAGRPTIAGLVTKWTEDRLPFMAWSPRTRQNYLAKMNRISRELGARTIAHTDCMLLEDWIARFCPKADTFNDWRYMFVLLWAFAVSRKLADANEGEKIIERSASKKLEANRKERRQLELLDFKEIHELAPAWLQLAMEQTLVTLQSRLEVCNMRHADYRDGHLFVIRDKSSSDSDMAFIRIALTDQLLDIQRRARQLDNTVSPYLIHRAPNDRRREWIDKKPHWTYVMPDYLTKSFAKVRDAIPRFAAMPEGERPTYHEARGLGSRLYRAQGMSEQAIQALMTHAHRRTTQIYLDKGISALTDADYVPVVAPLVLREVLGA